MVRLEALSRREPLVSGALVVAIGILAYGLLIPWLGFYWDDWFYMWAGHQGGARAIYENLATDRPMGGALFGLDHLLLGFHRVAWHLHALVLRIAGGLVLLWGVRALWPRERMLTTALALLFTIYPGFTMQAIAYCYQSYRLALLVGLFSVAASFRAAVTQDRGTRYALTVAAVVAALFYLFLMEVYIGLEAIRVTGLLVLARRLDRRAGASLRFVAERYAPYLICVVAFLVWRLFFYHAVREAANVEKVLASNLGNAGSNLLRFPAELWRDILEAGVFAWFAAAITNVADLSPLMFVVSQLVGVVAMTLVVLWTRWLERRPAAPGSSPAAELLLVAIPSILAAPVLTLFARRQIRLVSLLDRYTLPVSLAAAFLVVALLAWLYSPATRAWVLAGMVGLCVTAQVASADVYRRNWDTQRQLWWQMSWRAPALQEGTFLLLRNPGIVNSASSQYEVWEPANFVYRYQAGTLGLWGSQLTEGLQDQLRRGEHGFTEHAVLISYQVDLSKTLLITLPHDGTCVRAIDGERDGLPLPADGVLAAMARYSSTDRIKSARAGDGLTVARPPVGIFGAEPAHDWCYFFEKAELARQQGDWAEVAVLADQALPGKPRVADASELLVFVEGYWRNSRQADAARVSSLAVSMNKAVIPALCELWERNAAHRTTSPDPLAATCAASAH